MTIHDPITVGSDVSTDLTLAAARDWMLDSETLASLRGTSWRRHVLPNGLTVLLQPHEGISLAHIAVGYRVGSMEEGPGQSGLAHFLEHMMFSGTRALPGGYIQRMLDLGATDVNAVTSRDMTIYHQTVPLNQLDFVLYAEADRMASFADNLDPAIIERERGVIQEEKRQNAAAPLGKLGEWLADGTVDRGHPYRHPVIGHAEDIARHDLTVLRAWHATHYGPGNSVLVVAGGIDPDETLDLVTRHFGGIAPGVRAQRVEALVPAMPRQATMRVADRVGGQGKLFMAWNTPSVVATPREHLALELAADMLGGGRAGALYEHLVEQRSLADDVIAWTIAGRASGTFIVHADLNAPPSNAAADAVEDVIRGFVHAVDFDERMERSKTNLLASRWRSTIEFESNAIRLMTGELLHGDARWADEELRLLADLDAGEVRDTIRHWLGVPGFRLMIERIASSSVSTPSSIDAPTAANAAAMDFTPPVVEERRLTSGATLRVVRRAGTDFHLRALGTAGRADEPVGLEGVAQVAGSLSSFGAGPSSPAELGARLRHAGLSLNVGTELRWLRIDIGGPSPALPAALATLSDLILRPRYGSPEYARVVKAMTATAAGYANTPQQRSEAASGAALYGRDHRLSAPNVSPRLDEVLTVEAMQAFHDAAWKPEGTVLLLAADIDADAAAELCNAMLIGWQASASSATLPRLNLAAVRPGIYVVDRPGSDTVDVSFSWRFNLAGDDVATISFKVLVNLLAGGFTSRFNRRLREDLGWTYGVMGGVVEPLPRRDPLVAFAGMSLDPERSGETIREVEAIVASLLAEAPPLEEEAEAARRNGRQHLARLNETSVNAVDAMQMMRDQDIHSDEDWSRYRDKIDLLSIEDLREKAARLLPAPGQAVWMLLGDTSRIRASLARQGLLDRVVNADN